MRGVVHRGQALPVAGPAVHVLEVAAADELDAAESARVPEFAHIQVLAAPDDRLHHHVLLPALPGRFHDLAGFLDGGASGYGAGHVLAGAQRGDGLRRVQVDGRIDVHRIHRRIADQVFKRGVALLHSEGVAHGIQLVLGTLADGVHLGLRMALVDGDELGTESESDDGDVEFSAHG